MGEIRKELRRWLGRPEDVKPTLAPLEPTPKDRMRVEAEYHRMQDAPRHPYLERGRRLPAELLASERFAVRIRIDGRGNAVFPHFDGQGLCGYELKNWHFTGFATGGEKGLWLSHHRPDDNRLVFAESAIDALSYAALHEASQTRYASIGGTPSPKQIALIAAAVATMPPGSEIVSAMDCDRAGRGLSQIIGNAAAQPGSRRVSFRVHSPDREGDDWNDVLEDRSAHSLPAAQRGPSFPKPPEF